MSEEIQTPTLRLKPRSRNDSESALSPLPETNGGKSSAGENGEAAGETVPRLRLRPKLDETPPTTAAVPVPTPAAPARPFSLKPRLVADPAVSAVSKSSEEPVAPIEPPVSLRERESPKPPGVDVIPAPEPPKFKLKEKAVQPDALPTQSAPPTFVEEPARQTVETPKPPPPFPVVAEIGSTPVNASLPPPAPQPTAQVDDGSNAAANGGKRGIIVKAGLAAAAVVVVFGIFIGYQKLKPRPAVAVPATSTVTKPTDAPRPSTPSATLNELSKVPAAAVAKAKATIAAADEKQGQQVGAVLDSSETEPLPRRPTARKQEVKAPAAVTSTTQLSPGLTATTKAKDVVGDASPAFRAWVAQARISGVFQGSPPRALINGRTVAAGNTVDETLGIIFDGFDSTAKNLLFRDASGATVTRKY